MIIISKFINKIIRKNILFVVTLLVINWHFITSWINITDRGISFNDYLSLRVYTCIIIGILTMLNVLFYMRKHYDSIKVLCKNEFEYFLGVCLAIIKNNFIFSCIPLIYIIPYSILIRPLPLSSIKSTLFILVFEWFLPFSVIAIVISFLSVTIKNLILKIAISSLFIYITSTKMLNAFMIEKNGIIRSALKTLNIFEDQAYAYYSDFIGKVVNISYIIDKILPLLFAFTLIIIAYIILETNKNRYIKSCSIFIIFLLAFFSLNIFASKTTTYTDDEIKYQEILSSDSLDKFEIKSHDIRADIGSKSTFEDNIVLINKSGFSQSKLELILDNIFNVESISVNGEQIEFEHSEDLLTLLLKHNITSNEELTIDIRYSGYINIQTSWNEYLYIATKNELLLPENSFIWFPKVKQSSLIDYNLSINSNNVVYSNIPNTSSKKNLIGYTYQFSGSSNDISLYSGEYKSSTVNGIDVVYAADSDYKKSLDIWYNKVLSGTEYLSDEKDIIDKSIKNNEIKKIIISRIPKLDKLVKDTDGNNLHIVLEQIFTGDTLIINKFN